MGVGDDSSDDDARPLTSIRTHQNRDILPFGATQTSRTEQANVEVAQLEQEPNPRPSRRQRTTQQRHVASPPPPHVLEIDDFRDEDPSEDESECEHESEL